MSDQESAYVSETGESAFAVRIETGGHAFVGDEPADKGGGGLGPSPYQMLAAALGECTAMTVRWYARAQKWPLEHVAVEVVHEKEAVEGRPGKVDVFRKTVRITGAALSGDQHRKLADIAAKCPVQRTLENASVIVTAADG